MLQIEHIYHFLFDNLFKDFLVISLIDGVPTLNKKIDWPDVVSYDKTGTHNVIFFYDQEPLFETIWQPYDNFIDAQYFDAGSTTRWVVVSEKSKVIDKLSPTHLYYFFHGFAALDWFRGYYLLNYKNTVVKKYAKDYISFNRTITGDRRYRKTFVDQLKLNNLLDKGLVSYGVTDDPVTENRLVIDQIQLPGSASAGIPITIERIDYKNDTPPDYTAFWHIVTETVFYYDKLHLTEKIFKPIVSKQPFMLLAAPGNLEYLRSYGFKTFDGIIDESYDTIEDNDARIDAVVAQLKWYCDLSDEEKTEIQHKCEPIVEYNFHHFYGKFKEIITDELLDNTKILFKEIKYDDSSIDYATVRKLLTT